MDAKIAHLLINKINLETKMYIQSDDGIQFRELLGTEKLPTPWEFFWKQKSQRGSESVVVVKHYFETRTLNEFTSCKNMVDLIRNRMSCLEDLIISEIILEHHNISHVHVGFGSKISFEYSGRINMNVMSVDAKFIFEKYILDFVIGLHAFYCFQKEMVTNDYLGWMEIGFFEPISWILIGVSYLAMTAYAYTKDFVDYNIRGRKNTHLSWLTGISLMLGKDYTPLLNVTFLILTFCCFILSSVYLCFVKGHYTIPLLSQPFDHFTDLIANGFRFSDWVTRERDIEIIQSNLFESNNVTYENHLASVPKNFAYFTESEQLQYYEAHKIFIEERDFIYKNYLFSLLNCHILPEPYFTSHTYWKFKDRFQNRLAESLQDVFASGIQKLVASSVAYKSQILRYETKEISDYVDNLPASMKISSHIYTIFVVSLFMLLFSFTVNVVESYKQVVSYLKAIYKRIQKVKKAFELLQQILERLQNTESSIPVYSIAQNENGEFVIQM
jgi:hypothetical protein